MSAPRQRGKLTHLQNQATMEPCPACEGIAAAGETCRLCRGAGMVTTPAADRWRVSKGLPPRYSGTLPRPTLPPRKR